MLKEAEKIMMGAFMAIDTFMIVSFVGYLLVMDHPMWFIPNGTYTLKEMIIMISRWEAIVAGLEGIAKASWLSTVITGLIAGILKVIVNLTRKEAQA